MMKFIKLVMFVVTMLNFSRCMEDYLGGSPSEDEINVEYFSKLYKQKEVSKEENKIKAQNFHHDLLKEEDEDKKFPDLPYEETKLPQENSLDLRKQKEEFIVPKENYGSGKKVRAPISKNSKDNMNTSKLLQLPEAIAQKSNYEMDVIDDNVAYSEVRKIIFKLKLSSLVSDQLYSWEAAMEKNKSNLKTAKDFADDLNYLRKNCHLKMSDAIELLNLYYPGKQTTFRRLKEKYEKYTKKVAQQDTIIKNDRSVAEPIKIHQIKNKDQLIEFVEANINKYEDDQILDISDALQGTKIHLVEKIKNAVVWINYPETGWTEIKTTQDLEENKSSTIHPIEGLIEENIFMLYGGFSDREQQHYYFKIEEKNLDKIQIDK